MSNERSNNPNRAEFAQICMEWLKSNKHTLTVKDRYNDDKLIYVKIPSEGLDYIYNISTYWLRTSLNATLLIMLFIVQQQKFVYLMVFLIETSPFRKKNWSKKQLWAFMTVKALERNLMKSLKKSFHQSFSQNTKIK